MKVFLATSFSTKLASDGTVLPEFRQKVEAIITRYKVAGREVYCAAQDEGWKIAQDANASFALKEDFVQIKLCDEFAALIDETISAGVQMQIGYALGIGKRITLITEDHIPLNWTNQALIGLPNVSHLVI